MNRPLTAAEQQEQINQFSDYQIVQMCEHLDDTTLKLYVDEIYNFEDINNIYVFDQTHKYL